MRLLLLVLAAGTCCAACATPQRLIPTSLQYQGAHSLRSANDSIRLGWGGGDSVNLAGDRSKLAVGQLFFQAALSSNVDAGIRQHGAAFSDGFGAYAKLMLGRDGETAWGLVAGVERSWANERDWPGVRADSAYVLLLRTARLVPHLRWTAGVLAAGDLWMENVAGQLRRRRDVRPLALANVEVLGCAVLEAGYAPLVAGEWRHVFLLGASLHLSL